MPKLPRGEQAIVDVTKLVDYVLNPAHERGKHKARVFASALGIRQSDARELRAALKAAAAGGDATETSYDSYGQRYVIDFEMRTEAGSAIIRSAWLVAGETPPRLLTCYVLG
jgi:hypothetical protein